MPFLPTLFKQIPSFLWNYSVIFFHLRPETGKITAIFSDLSQYYL